MRKITFITFLSIFAIFLLPIFQNSVSAFIITGKSENENLTVKVTGYSLNTVSAPKHVYDADLFPVGSILFTIFNRDANVHVGVDKTMDIRLDGKRYTLSEGASHITIQDGSDDAIARLIDVPLVYDNGEIFTTLDILRSVFLESNDQLNYDKTTNTLTIDIHSWTNDESEKTHRVRLDGKLIGEISSPMIDSNYNLYPMSEIFLLIDPTSTETIEDYNGFGLPYSKITLGDYCYEFIKYRDTITQYDRENNCSIATGETATFYPNARYYDNRPLLGVFAPAEVIEKMMGEKGKVTEKENELIIQTKSYLEYTAENNMIILVKIDDPWMYVNDELKMLDPTAGSLPVIKDGRTLLPIATIIEELGGEVKWDGIERKVSISLGTNHVEVWIDQVRSLVNGEEKILDVGPTIINSRTMVPLRFVSENLGLQIGWDSYNQIAGIYYGDFDKIDMYFSGYFIYTQEEEEEEEEEQQQSTNSGNHQNTNTTDPLDSDGQLIHVSDVVSVGMFEGEVTQINGTNILVYWNSKSMFVPDGDEEFWAGVLGIRYQASSWIESNKVTITSSGY